MKFLYLHRKCHTQYQKYQCADTTLYYMFWISNDHITILKKLKTSQVVQFHLQFLIFVADYVAATTVTRPLDVSYVPLIYHDLQLFLIHSYIAYDN